MKTIKINVYPFAELSAEAKRKALTDHADINVDFEWYRFLYDDAQRIGVEIKDFDIDDNFIKGEFIQDAEIVAANIMREYAGPVAAIAQEFLAKVKGCKDIDCGYDESQRVKEDAVNAAIEHLSNEFLKSVLHSFLKDLREQCNHSTSDEAIIETIEANDYLFFDTGKLIPASMYPLPNV